MHPVMGGSPSPVPVFLAQYLRSTFHNLDNEYLLMTILAHTKAFGKLDHSRFKKYIDSITFGNQLYNIDMGVSNTANHGHGS